MFLVFFYLQSFPSSLPLVLSYQKTQLAIFQVTHSVQISVTWPLQLRRVYSTMSFTIRTSLLPPRTSTFFRDNHFLLLIDIVEFKKSLNRRTWNVYDTWQWLAGMCPAIGLSGRPSRPFGLLGTSKFYRVGRQLLLCYPLLYEIDDFYLSQDLTAVIQDAKVGFCTTLLLFCVASPCLSLCSYSTCISYPTRAD